jgi:hypothetical protein
MKIMGKIILTLTLVILAAPGLMAGTIQTGNFGPYQTGAGGEFTVNSQGFSFSLNLTGYVADVTKFLSNGKDPNIYGLTFQTFCLERHEQIARNHSYDGTVNDAAVFGGVGGADPLSVGTAWLYKNFAETTLAGYDYTNPGRSDGVGSSADLLQQAIWCLEDEVSCNAANTFYLAAVAQFGSEAGAKADNNGQFSVKVINLWEGSPHDTEHARQDILVNIIPVPDGGLTLLLLGMGLTSVGVLSRKFKK